MIIYSKRCKRNLIDDGAFIDILYKISHFFYGECQDKAERFQKFLDDYILAKIKDVLSKKTHKPSFSKIEVFDGEFSFENRSLRLFEGGDELLKHVNNTLNTIHNQNYSDIHAIFHLRLQVL